VRPKKKGPHLYFGKKLGKILKNSLEKLKKNRKIRKNRKN